MSCASGCDITYWCICMKNFVDEKMRTQLTMRALTRMWNSVFVSMVKGKKSRSSISKLFFPSGDGTFGRIERLNIQPDPFDRFAKFGERSVLTLLISREVTFDGKKNSYLSLSFLSSFFFLLLILSIRQKFVTCVWHFGALGPRENLSTNRRRQ